MILAHYDRDTNKKQSLFDHAVKTAEYAKNLGEKVGLPTLCFLAGLLHDIGKADRIFQQKISGQCTQNIIHSSAGLKYVLEGIKKNGENDSLFQEMGEVLAYVIGAHHGVFDVPAQDGSYRWVSRLRLKEDYNTEKYHYEEDVLPFTAELEGYCQSVYQADIGTLLQKSFDEYRRAKTRLKPKDSKEAAFYTGLFVRLILSILKNSDVVDTINAFEKLIEPVSEQEYEKIGKLYLDRIEDLYASYGEPKTDMNKIRTELADQVKERGDRDPRGIYRLDLPTGAGKTQVSLRYAVHQMAKQKRARIFYIAPFLSVLEQNAQVIREILKEGVLEHHSNVVEKKSVDAKRNAMSEEDEVENRAYAFRQYLKESWDAPMVVTTMVQFANTLFKNKADNLRRFASFIDAVVILDEVQSLPVHTTYLFNSTMNFMTAVMKTSFVLCTATQPTYDLKKLDYPLNYAPKERANIVALQDEDRKVFERTQIYLMHGGKEVGLEEIEREIKRFPEDSFLVVLNTKKVVEELYDLCKEKWGEENQARKIYYLSTHLCPAHRKETIEQIRKELSDGEPLVVISTQLIEAGVDLDFNRLIRSYAGIDSIVQAAGRCNREGALRGRKGIVKLANLSKHKENLKMLLGIKDKKEITQNIFFNCAEPEREIDLTAFSNDFFKKYFTNNRDKMGYPVAIQGETREIYDLLSCNEEFCFEKGPTPLMQSFEEAGRLFELIRDDTRGVLVYYKESKKRIDELKAVIEDYEKSFDKGLYKKIKEFLRALQPYTVNLYHLEKFKKALESIMGGEILILCQQHYDPIKGVVADASEESFIL